MSAANKQDIFTRLQAWDRLKMPDHKLTELLNEYILKPSVMKNMGYPVIINKDTGEAVIYKTPHKPHHNFNVDAREFVPKRCSQGYDSGQDSATSSDSDEKTDEARCHHQINVQPLPDKPQHKQATEDGRKRTCARCHARFNPKSHINMDGECRYHWGKVHTAYLGVGQYTCCRTPSGTQGCTTNKCHVWNGIEDGANHFPGFVETKQTTGRREQPIRFFDGTIQKEVPFTGNCGVYALDCEMAFTVAGLELTQVTLVAINGLMVYESYVKPSTRVLDYNTRFSGVTSGDMKNAKSLKKVQSDLLNFISADTILIGHGLENDLRALRMVHYNIVDTVHAFPHHLGLPYRRSLKQLAAYILKWDIQSGMHSSYEDAVTCLELILTLVQKKHITDGI